MKQSAGIDSKFLLMSEIAVKRNHVRTGRKRTRVEATLTLGELIQNYRKRSRTSMRALAEELGVSSSMISFMEGDVVFPGAVLLNKLAKVLRQDASELKALDPRISFRELRRVVKRNPELHDALKFMLDELREGRAFPKDFAERIKP